MTERADEWRTEREPGHVNGGITLLFHQNHALPVATFGDGWADLADDLCAHLNATTAEG